MRRQLCRAHTALMVSLVLMSWMFHGETTHASPQDQEDSSIVPADLDFARDIKPIFETRCLSCHGPEEQEADFRIDDRTSVLSNYVFAGDAEGSPLFEYIIAEDPAEMMPPPEEGGPLPDQQIELIRNWIDGDAAWPAEVTLEPPTEEVAEAAQEEIQQDRQLADREKSAGRLLWEICGLLHPLAIHFPVALLIGGALFAVLGIRGQSPLSDAAFYCLWLGALGSIFAVASGWSFAIDKAYGDWQSFDWNETIDLHRWGGIGVAVLSLVLAITATISRRRDPYASGVLWKLGLVILAIGAGFVGHQGGKLTHKGLHDRVFDKTMIVGDKIFGQGDEGEDEPGDPTASEDDAEGSGRTSDEDDGENTNEESDATDEDDAADDQATNDDVTGDNETEGDQIDDDQAADDDSSDG